MTLGSAPPFEHLADQKLKALMIALRGKVAPILANNLLPHFTDHSVAHSDNVTKRVDQLLQQAKLPLSDGELMILYSACYLHDIGMQYERAGETQVIERLNLIPSWDEQSETTRRNLLRQHHHRISAEMVRLSSGAANPPIGMQLTPEFNPPYVAQLCHAHAIATDSEEYRGLVQDGPGIRMRLLSALLRIADILDESRHRAQSEKARTLLLDKEAQKHWWRHRYTEDVTFDLQHREVTVWFDFPEGLQEEYSRIIPALQMPWIQAEFGYHNSVLLENGCQWAISSRTRSKPYSDIPAMPEEVQIEMLKELSHRQRIHNEKLRLTALAQYKEARPSVQRRLDTLKEEEATLGPGEYLLKMSQVATDLYQFGGRKAAEWLLHGHFMKDLQYLAFDARLRIGRQLLEWHVEARDDFQAMQLLEKLGPEFDGLQLSDERKWSFTELRIKVLDMACAYDQAKSAIIDAITWAPEKEKESLEADLAELRLLQWDFLESES